MKHAILMGAFGALALGAAYSQQRANAEPAPASAPSGLYVNRSVHSIHLPEVDDEPQLPPGVGRETTQVMCGMCHTTRYIMIQPRFSRETWTAEVTKMRKAFSGPIPEEKVPEIVDYLMAVRGVETK